MNEQALPSAPTSDDGSTISRPNEADRVETVAMDAPIVAVEVFRDRALVTRRATLTEQLRASLAQGPLLVELKGLPLGLDDGSLRVEASHPALTVREAQIALDVAPAAQNRRSEEEQLERLQRRRAWLEARQQRARQQADQLLGLRPELPPQPRRVDRERFADADPVAAWLALLSFASQRAQDELAAAQSLHRQLETLDDELARARDALATLSTAALRERDISKRVYLSLAQRGELPVLLELSLSYLVAGAAWAPSYELRVDADGSGATLSMSAALAQVSGEDWQDVQLALCTADLQRHNELPSLGSWRIGRHQPPSERAWRPLPDDLQDLFADYDRARPTPPPAPPAPATFVVTSTLDRRDDFAEDKRRVKKKVAKEREVWAEEYEADAFDKADAFDEPMPSAAPMAPQEAPMMQRSAGPLGMLSGLLSRSEAVAPSGGNAKAAAANDQTYGGGDSRAGTNDSALPDSDLLGYTALALAGPEEPRARGTLQLLPPTQRAAGRRLDPAEEQAFAAKAHELAEKRSALFSLPLPRGARWVRETGGHFAHRYGCPAPRSIVADGELHRVKVLEARVPLSLLYRTLPRVDSSVYRVAVLHNATGQPLLAGPLDVFWGNDYLVTTQLETAAAGARLETSLGLEPRIKVVRNTRHEQHEEGLLSGRTVHEETIEIELANGLDRSVTIEVLERLPVSEERKVEIELTHEEPPGERYQQKERHHPVRGGRRWTRTLAAGAHSSCKLAYRVTLPASSEIVGGGRRAER